MAAQQPKLGTVKIFISYSHADAYYFDQFEKHLRTKLDGFPIEHWSDRRLSPGDRWHEKIVSSIRSSRVAVCLISVDFLASRYIREVEIPLLLDMHLKCEFRILPVIIRASAFEDSELRHFNALNDPRHPIAAIRPAAARDRHWHDVSSRIRDVAQEIARGVEDDRSAHSCPSASTPASRPRPVGSPRDSSVFSVGRQGDGSLSRVGQTGDAEPANRESIHTGDEGISSARPSYPSPRVLSTLKLMGARLSSDRQHIVYRRRFDTWPGDVRLSDVELKRLLVRLHIPRSKFDRLFRRAS